MPSECHITDDGIFDRPTHHRPTHKIDSGCLYSISDQTKPKHLAHIVLE